MTIREEALQKHGEWGGKIEVAARVPVENSHDLSVAYTPGVAEPCLAIAQTPDLSYTLTRRHNLVAVVTDGSAVLGLGNIGGVAGMPVMEGKCVLFKAFADVDAFPICVQAQDVDTVVETVYQISGSFGGINLEDIAAPRCFEIERKLKERCDIPVFHDDQHGTAVVVGAAVLNALKAVKKDLSAVKIVLNGAGAAGTAIAEHLLRLGAKNLIACDKQGILAADDAMLSPAHRALAQKTNPARLHGSLAEALRGADVFIGVSAPNIVSEAMVASMNAGAVVFPMANPTPEIAPEKAKAAGAAVVGTGRSDFPNQINNVLAFPGIFRGALNVRAREINDEMKVAASLALAELVAPQELCAEYILPKAFDKRVGPAVARAVEQAARDTKVARL